MEGNGWIEWKNAVLLRLDQNAEEIKALRADVASLGIQVSALQQRSGLWGVGAALVMVLLLLLPYLLGIRR